MLNTPEVYENAGMEAGRSARHGDAATARQWREWMSRAIKLERAEDRRTAQTIYDAAYQKAATPRGSASNPRKRAKKNPSRVPVLDARRHRELIAIVGAHARGASILHTREYNALVHEKKVLETRYPELMGTFWAGRKNPVARARRRGWSDLPTRPACARPARAPAPLPATTRPVRVKQRELKAAVELFHKFREAPPRRVRLAHFKVPKVCLVIGEMDFVGYTTTHARKRVRYRHDFRRAARPLLCSSADGRQLLIFGGNYDFTRDGIVDRA